MTNQTSAPAYHEYQKCIDACLRCAAICNHCASSCLKEDNVKMMAACIQLDMECAAICYTAAQLMSLGSAKAKDVCRICADICRECAAECGKHGHEHCKEMRRRLPALRGRVRIHATVIYLRRQQGFPALIEGDCVADICDHV